jgi:hypothetical protein
VSVDTYLKRKNLEPYQALDYQDVKIYVAHSLIKWARVVYVDARRGLLSKSFDVEAEHNHTVSCAH